MFSFDRTNGLGFYTMWQTSMNGKCGHGPLDEDARRKPWLEKESSAHKALAKIVLDVRLLNTLVYFVNFK